MLPFQAVLGGRSRRLAMIIKTVCRCILGLPLHQCDLYFIVLSHSLYSWVITGSLPVVFTMSDPLSLAAGIVGLVSLTIQVLQVANKFKNDVKDVHEEITSLIEELAALNSVLELLKKAWENRRTPAIFDLSALARIEATCEARLKDLLKTLLRGQVRLQKCAKIHSLFFKMQY
jgi:hypothetical protein